MTTSNPYIPEFNINKLIDEIQRRFQFIIQSSTLSTLYSMSSWQLHLVS
jgi:hypothetical protein